MLRSREKKEITFIIVNNNNNNNNNDNNGHNYKENSNFIAAIWNVLLSSFSKARKIKWPSFLQMKGSRLLKRKSIISFALNEWKLFDICDLKNQGDIAFHEGKEFSMKCCSSSILFRTVFDTIWYAQEFWACSISCMSIINLWLLVLNFATMRRWFVFFIRSK